MANPTSADYARLMQQVVALRSRVERQQEPPEPNETWSRCPNKCGQFIRADLFHFCPPPIDLGRLKLEARLAKIERWQERRG